MSSELAGWLRRQRQARGWPIAEMARQLRRAAADGGDHTMPGGTAMCRNIRRWENGNGGISERHKLHYCRALDISPEEFGPTPPTPAASHPEITAALPVAPLTAAFVTGQLVPHLTSAAVIPAAQTPSELAYRWIEAPEPGEATVEREVLMAAHEGSEHAEQAERRDIGEATLEQLRADVVRLSREYMTAEPLPLFREMRRVRSRMLAALDRRLWPRDQTELYLLLGCLNCLMGDTADDLGNPHAAEELLHAAWAYAMVIDHRPLMAKLRLDLASIAYWSGRPREACALAASGLDYLPDGQSLPPATRWSASSAMNCWRSAASLISLMRPSITSPDRLFWRSQTPRGKRLASLNWRPACTSRGMSMARHIAGVARHSHRST